MPNKYGTYLYGDGFDRVIQHLDGRDSLTTDEFTWDFNPVDGFKRVMHNTPLYSPEEIYRRETMEQSTYEIPDDGLWCFEDPFLVHEIPDSVQPESNFEI